MPTLEVVEALAEVAKAERCVLDCNRELLNARRRRDLALNHQRDLETERARLEISLNPGQLRLGARVAREMTPQERYAAEERIRELDAVLSGGPERRAGRLY